jgi:HPt (histidine-containing phosphotransfer) domain-containing protein
VTTFEALNELLADLHQREKTLSEMLFARRKSGDSNNAERLGHKLEGLRLAIGVTELHRNRAVRDEAEASDAPDSSQAVAR